MPTVQEVGWASGSVWTGAENLAPHRDSIPGPSRPLLVAKPTELHREPPLFNHTHTHNHTHGAIFSSLLLFPPSQTQTSSLVVKEHVSRPHKTRKITVLHIWNITLFNSKRRRRSIVDGHAPLLKEERIEGQK